MQTTLLSACYCTIYRTVLSSLETIILTSSRELSSKLFHEMIPWKISETQPKPFLEFKDSETGNTTLQRFGTSDGTFWRVLMHQKYYGSPVLLQIMLPFMDLNNIPLFDLFLYFLICQPFLEFWPGDKLIGEASRIVVAEACIQSLDIESTEGQIFEINSIQVISYLKFFISELS